MYRWHACHFLAGAVRSHLIATESLVPARSAPYEIRRLHAGALCVPAGSRGKHHCIARGKHSGSARSGSSPASARPRIKGIWSVVVATVPLSPVAVNFGPVVLGGTGISGAIADRGALPRSRRRWNRGVGPVLAPQQRQPLIGIVVGLLAPALRRVRVQEDS